MKRITFLLIVATTCLFISGACSNQLSREVPKDSFLLLMDAYKNFDSATTENIAKKSKMSEYFGISAIQGMEKIGGETLVQLGDLLERRDSVGGYFYDPKRNILGERKIYQIWAEYVILDDDKVYFKDVNIVDLDYVCNHHWIIAPESRVEFRNLKYQMKFDGITINQAYVDMWNRDNEPITGLDFQLQLLIDKRIVFSKTLFVDQLVQPGDLHQIPVSELTNFHLGKRITKENFSWTVKILEVRPKEIAPECNTAKMVREKYQNELKG